MLEAWILQMQETQAAVAPALDLPVLVAQANSAASYDRVQLHDSMGRHQSIYPSNLATNARLWLSQQKNYNWNESSPVSVVAVLNKPKYGKLIQEGQNNFGYEPQRLGTEYLRFIVQNEEGRKMIVTWRIDIRADLEVGQASSEQGVQYAEYQTLLADKNNLNAWFQSAQLSALIASAQQTLTAFTDLPATALGQTKGEGRAATITLDTNAAGHNWYIDPTLLDNADDYLPTSSPNIWQAKAGSAADGKMDMLSVLLHEYGHALGLEHSADSSDYMAASLQPGVRKLPSNEELALMARLVAELKGADGEALTLALSQGERGQDNPFAPSPLSALGLLPLGFMRRNDGKGSATAAVAAGAATATHTDYLTAINTTLANGNFSAGQNASIDQWESVGNVAATPATASQSVTLGESTTAQAHLAQAFVLSAQDRFLTFTVSGLDLQTNSIEQNGVFTTAPQDAFEVALQNANTGANLLANGAGGVGNYPF